MNTPSLTVQSFFKEYEEGANTFDVAINQKERAETWLVADPHGVYVGHNDDAFPEKLQKRHQQLRAMGYQSARITSLQELKLDNYYSVVKTAWRQEYQKDGTTIEVDITVDYIVRIEDDKTVKIICSIAHEDEEKLLEAKGLTR